MMRGEGNWGIVTAGSRHQGGAHVLMADGAVKFVTDSIEAGNQNAPPFGNAAAPFNVPGQKSSYGLWGALGTLDTKETVDANQI